MKGPYRSRKKFVVNLRIGVSLAEGGSHWTAVCAGVGETTGGWQGTGH